MRGEERLEAHQLAIRERKFVACYMRFHSTGLETFDSAQEAAKFLLRGEEYGDLSYRYIISPTGGILCDHGNTAGYADLEELAEGKKEYSGER